MYKIRYHHILCMHLYRGFGYDRAFCERMTEVTQELAKHPEQCVQLVVGADDLCAACPHCHNRSCAQGDDMVVNMDCALQSLLGEKSVMRWNEIRQRLVSQMDEDAFCTCCAECSWFQTGVCSFKQFANAIK